MGDSVAVWAVNFAVFAEVLLSFCGIVEACQSASVDGDGSCVVPYMQNGRNWTPSRTHTEFGCVCDACAVVAGGRQAVA